ncbi:helix-turn-helix domain-containing protein [Flindersiella endophytica]
MSQEPPLADSTTSECIDPAMPGTSESPLLELAPWEIQLLELVVCGYANEAAARQLEVSARTVRRRIQHWCDRVGVGCVTQLAAWAVEVELIRSPVSRSHICIAFTHDLVQIWGDRLDQRHARIARFGLFPMRVRTDSDTD